VSGWHGTARVRVTSSVCVDRRLGFASGSLEDLLDLGIWRSAGVSVAPAQGIADLNGKAVTFEPFRCRTGSRWQLISGQILHPSSRECCFD